MKVPRLRRYSESAQAEIEARLLGREFESYRALGSYTVMELGRQAGFSSTRKAQKPGCLTEFFKGARKGLARSRAATEV